MHITNPKTYILLQNRKLHPWLGLQSGHEPGKRQAVLICHFSSPSAHQRSRLAPSTGQPDHFEQHKPLTWFVLDNARRRPTGAQNRQTGECQKLAVGDPSMASQPIATHFPGLNATLVDFLDVFDHAVATSLPADGKSAEEDFDKTDVIASLKITNFNYSLCLGIISNILPSFHVTIRSLEQK